MSIRPLYTLPFSCLIDQYVDIVHVEPVELLPAFVFRYSKAQTRLPAAIDIRVAVEYNRVI
jgi:hypothetical protein